MLRLYRKITILLILKTSMSLKMAYVPILNNMNIMTLPRFLSSIDFDMVRL